MTVVLDASGAMEIALKRSRSAEYSEIILEADMVAAPDIFVSAVSNFSWKYYKLADFTHEQSLNLASDCIELIDQIIPAESLWVEALRESICFDHPVYDTLYAVCARRSDGLLLTTDNRLRDLCDKLHVTWA